MLLDSIDLKSLYTVFRFMTEGFQERPLSHGGGSPGSLTLITIQGAGSGCASTNMLHWLPPGPRMRERRFTHLPVRFSREAWALKTTSRSTMNSSFTSWESGWSKNLGMRIREAKINLTIDENGRNREWKGCPTDWFSYRNFQQQKVLKNVLTRPNWNWIDLPILYSRIPISRLMLISSRYLYRFHAY